MWRGVTGGETVDSDTRPGHATQTGDSDMTRAASESTPAAGTTPRCPTTASGYTRPRPSPSAARDPGHGPAGRRQTPAHPNEGALLRPVTARRLRARALRARADPTAACPGAADVRAVPRRRRHRPALSRA